MNRDREGDAAAGDEGSRGSAGMTGWERERKGSGGGKRELRMNRRQWMTRKQRQRQSEKDKGSRIVMLG